MTKYRVLWISNNLEDYPECTKDTKEFSHLVSDVEDEMDIFIVNTKTGGFHKASEFFHQVDITSFEGDR